MHGTLILNMLAMQGTSTSYWKKKTFLFSTDLYLIIFHEIKSIIYYPNRLLHFGVLGYANTRASRVASNTRENPSELLTTVKKGLFLSLWEKQIPWKGRKVKLFICTQNTRMCHSTWKALQNTKEGGRKTLLPHVPKVPPPMNRDIYRWRTLSSVGFHRSLTRTLTLKHQTRSSSIYTRRWT